MTTVNGLRLAYRGFVLDWGIEYYEAVVRWADATLAELRAPD